MHLKSFLLAGILASCAIFGGVSYAQEGVAAGSVPLTTEQAALLQQIRATCDNAVDVSSNGKLSPQQSLDAKNACVIGQIDKAEQDGRLPQWQGGYHASST